MYRPFAIAATLILVAFAVSPATAAGKAYKWVDAEGNVHYGSAPPRGAKATEVRLPSQAVPEAPAADAEAETPPPGAPAPASERLSEEQQAAMRQVNDANCRIARQNLQTLDRMPQRLVEVDSEGNEVEIPNEEVEQRRERARQNIDRFCR